jgi:hypothetical protein
MNICANYASLIGIKVVIVILRLLATKTVSNRAETAWATVFLPGSAHQSFGSGTAASSDFGAARKKNIGDTLHISGPALRGRFSFRFGPILPSKFEAWTGPAHGPLDPFSAHSSVRITSQL